MDDESFVRTRINQLYLLGLICASALFGLVFGHGYRGRIDLTIMCFFALLVVVPFAARLLDGPTDRS